MTNSPDSKIAFLQCQDLIRHHEQLLECESESLHALEDGTAVSSPQWRSNADLNMCASVLQKSLDRNHHKGLLHFVYLRQAPQTPLKARSMSKVDL